MKGSKKIQPINVGGIPELLRIAQEVHASGHPRLLRKDNEDLAVVVPAPSRRRFPSRAKAVTEDDALFRLIGIGETDVPGGISARKHEYLGHTETPRSSK
ncbi:MAG: hypothetical protein HY675_19720 [Chloroflexi bacterium]|nr:hypothetical protein [Chloroflexota bacterium]